MELELTYRRPDVIDYVASAIVLLNASCSEGRVRRWWVAPSIRSSCLSPSRRCFSTARHEKNRLQMGASMMSTHGAAPSCLDLLLNHRRTRSPLGGGGGAARVSHYPSRPILRYGCFAT